MPSRLPEEISRRCDTCVDLSASLQYGSNKSVRLHLLDNEHRYRHATSRPHGVAALRRAGDAMEVAVDRVLENPAARTADLGGSLGCKAFGNAVTRAVEAQARG